MVIFTIYFKLVIFSFPTLYLIHTKNESKPFVYVPNLALAQKWGKSVEMFTFTPNLILLWGWMLFTAYVGKDYDGCAAVSSWLQKRHSWSAGACRDTSWRIVHSQSGIKFSWMQGISKGESGLFCDPCVNAIGRRPYWRLRVETSYCTFGFGVIIRGDLLKLSLPRVLPRDNLYACVI